MARYSHRVGIDCEPEALFEVLLDPASNARWQAGVVCTDASTCGLATVGTRMTEVRELAGCRSEIVYELVELEWPVRTVVEIVAGPLAGTASYVCRPVAGGSELSVTFDVSPRGRWRLLAPAMSALMAAEVALSCQRLKSLLDAPALQPAGV